MRIENDCRSHQMILPTTVGKEKAYQTKRFILTFAKTNLAIAFDFECVIIAYCLTSASFHAIPEYFGKCIRRLTSLPLYL